MHSDFIDINLLPHPVRPALGGPAWRRLMVPGLLALMLAMFLVLGASIVKVRNDRALSEQEAQLARMSGEVRSLSVVLAEVEVLQQQITTLATQAEQLKADAERVNQQNPALAPFLRALHDSLLPRMSITTVVLEERNRYVIQGEAGSNALVVEYANALRRRSDIRQVTPRSIERLGSDAPPGAVRWTLEVER